MLIGNSLTPDDAEKLTNALKNIKTLRFIDISDNSIGDRGASYFNTLVDHIPGIETLVWSLLSLVIT